MLKRDYLFPIAFLVLPTLLALGLFIEQKVLSHGSYIYEIQDSDEWYNKDLKLKNSSWEEVKLEIKIFKDITDKVYNNFAKDTYDKNSLHVLTMQFHKKLIILKNYLNGLDKENTSDYKEYEIILDNIEENLERLISYNQNMIKPDYTTEFANIVNIIYLPLAVITGYFGMNFSSMGVHSKKDSGVYNENRGQLFVFTISAIVIIVYMYIMYETNKPYGAFDFFYKGSNKFTFTDYIFGTKEKDKKKKKRDIAGQKIKKQYTKDIKEESKLYTDTEPPPSLNIYNKEKDSLAPPIIRDTNLGPFDDSLFTQNL